MATIKSIEDKAKRYDVAIEKLRSLHDNYDSVSTLIDIKEELENIFPELKESEDEKIRKAIIKCLKWLQDEARWTDVYGISFDSIFAWLEKQGEQNPADKIEQNIAWDEEDKRKISRIYSILRQAADTHAFSTTCRLIGDKECIELQDFLKFLKDRYTWKPSDEQMDVLLSEVSAWTKGCHKQIILESLYNDLKKLKE